MIATVNEATVKPDIICATNQKKSPLMIIENNPSVMIFRGRVSNETIGFTTMFRNTRHTATITAVSMPFTAIPLTKYGIANIARALMSNRIKIMYL